MVKKNIVVVGYGGMGGGFHVKNALTSDVVELLGIYDIDPAKAEKARANGDRNVYFIDGKDLLKGRDREDNTVDGVHPNDLGFYRMAQKYIKFIQKNDLLKK